MAAVALLNVKPTGENFLIFVGKEEKKYKLLVLIIFYLHPAREK